MRGDTLLDRLTRRLRAILKQSIPGGGLASRTVKSGIWLTAMNVSDRVLQMILMVVLARLLAPRDFGLLGIGLLTLSALQQFTKLGLNQALIYNKEEDVDHYLDTAWSLQIGRGLLLASIMFVAAPFIASFFGEPRARDVIRVISLTPLIYGFRNPAVVYFQKDLEFHKQFVLTLSGSVVNFMVAISYALVNPSVWALVFGFVFADVTRLGASYLLDGYRPWPRIDLERAKELIDYGKWITGEKIVQFLVGEGDDAVVGWLLNATALGYYQMAYQLARTPATEITHIVGRVMFPAYSRLQDDVDALREAFFRTVQLTTFVAFPVGVGILVVTPTFVRAIIGEQWLPMVTTMQMLAFYGIVISMAATFGPIWKAIGRPDYLAKLGAFRLVLMGIAIIPATTAYGIEGTAAVVVGLYLFPILPLDIYLVVNSVEATYDRLFREVAYPAVASTTMGLVVYGVHLSFDGSPLVEFILMVATGVVVYVAAVGILEIQFDWGLERNFRNIVEVVKS